MFVGVRRIGVHSVISSKLAAHANRQTCNRRMGRLGNGGRRRAAHSFVRREYQTCRIPPRVQPHGTAGSGRCCWYAASCSPWSRPGLGCGSMPPDRQKPKWPRGARRGGLGQVNSAGRDCRGVQSRAQAYVFNVFGWIAEAARC
jgi:hypothetical protein